MATKRSASTVSLAASPVCWGVLGVANIATQKVIPAMRIGTHTPVVAIASRDRGKAQRAADKLGIPIAYGSYEELLSDPNVEAVYNPLPNHLHVPWTIRAADAGKHVLCEKPLALTAREARELIAARDRNGVQIAEAFMVRSHPQWTAVRELVAEGRIGDLRLISGHFSYFRRDASDIRSNPDWGGGALMDIGCYPITMSRWLFDEEPTGAFALVERDHELRIDHLVSGMLQFPSGQATFSVGGQLVPHQKVEVFGTEARIEIEIPFNAPPDRECRIFIDDGSALAGGSAESIVLPAVDQYHLQAERFSEAIRGIGDVIVSLEDSVANMSVMDALVRSETSGRVERP